MTPAGAPRPQYRVETFDHFGRRVDLKTNLTRDAAVTIGREWLARSPQHTAKVTAGAYGPPVML